MRTLLISGLSGAGKSSVVKMLEDLEFYCVDNLPVPLIRSFFDLSTRTLDEIQKLALVVDARDKAYIGQLPDTLRSLSREGRSVEVVFMEASDDVLARRFSETRHRHPLSPEGSALEGIRKERKLLAEVRKMANKVIDTSNYTTQDLRQELRKTFGELSDSPAMALMVSSFGFKYGLPVDADLVLDVRFLPNPYFREHLKAKTGTDQEVIDYVLAQKDTIELMKEYQRFFGFLMPRFEREGKSYLHIAIGCTGGRHRSVVMASEVARWLKEQGKDVNLVHRDVEKKQETMRG